MKMKALVIISLIALNSLAAVGGFAYPLENVTLEDWAVPWQQDWAYSALDHFVAKGYLPGHFYRERPITEKEFTEAVELIIKNVPSTRWDKLDRYYLSRLSALFNIPLLEPSSSSAEKNTGYIPGYLLVGEDQGFKYHLGGSLGGGGILTRKDSKKDTLFAELGLYGSLSLGEHITLHDQIRVRRVFKDTPGPYDFPVEMLTATQDWAGFLPAVEQAYANIDFKYFTLEVGRDRLVWGPGYRSALLLSLNQPSLDFFRLRTHFGRISFESFVAAIDPPSDTFLSGHRISFRITDRASLSASEVIIFAEQGLLLQYFNPIVPYYVLQWNQKDKDNVLWSLDGEYRLFNGLRVYSEFLIDDFQYESNPPGAPNKLGLTVGGQYVPSFLPGLDLHLEYSRATRYTYTHMYERNRYLNRGRCIGFWLGPDADQLYAELGYFLTPWLQPSVYYDRERKGEGRIGETWHEGIDAKGLPFPSGIVQTTNAFGLTISGEPLLWRLDYYLGVRLEKTKNLGNVAGVNQNLIETYAMLRFNL
jgi:hypothetical protein